MLSSHVREFFSFRSFIVVALFLMSSAASAYDVSVSIQPESVTFSSSDSRVAYVAVSVVKVNGDEVFFATSEKSITWALNDSIEDGRYKYELTFSNIVAGSGDRIKTSTVEPKIIKRAGALLVQSGSLVLPQSEEEVGWLPAPAAIFASVLEFLIPSAHAQQEVILSSLVVDGSACVGTDCANGEVFSFDTIRFKENNLRLHFDDTSVSASFPSNDWRIIINDSANGGNNFFAIEDSNTGSLPFYLEAGAQSNALYVDANGRVGFGTATPATSLETRFGSTPTLRFNQDGSQGFTPQVWDIGGNEQGFFVSDVSGSLTTPMFIAAGAPSNALYVSNSGSVGIGTNNPTESLHVVGNAIISGNLELASSREIKHAIENLDLSDAVSALLDLQPVSYRYNHLPDQTTLGFIAEDVPDLVASESRKSLKPMDIVAVLTKVVQEQQMQIQTLSEKVERLSEQEK